MWTKIWTKIKESFFTALTAVLIIFTVFILVWIPIKFIPKMFSGFQNEVATSLSSMLIPAKNLDLSLNKKSITTGDNFSIQISNTSNEEEYLLSYPCIVGVKMKISDSTNTEILCGQEFYLLRNDGIINLIGYSTSSRYLTVPITISRQVSVDSKLEKLGTVRIAITNPATKETSGSSVIDDSYVTPTQNLIVYSGKPDLLIRILEKGVIDRNTGLFRKTDYITSTDRAAIRFEVRNIGEGITGAWNFTATLPSTSMSYYTSDSQVSLNPNDRVEYTLGFDNPNTTGVNLLTIQVDPTNYINEIVESNNTLSEYFTVNFNNNYNYNNDWYNYNNYNNYTTLTGSCSASPYSVQSGSSMTWYAQATGGTGSYTYYWTGTDSLSGYGQNLSKVYYTTGAKSATVTIASGGQSITRECTAYVNSNNYNNGQTDLSIRLIGVGTLNSSGQFNSSTQIARGSTVAVKVEVTNNGGQATGLWDISSTLLPSMSGYTYRSENIISLNSGDKTEMTITFNNPTYVGDNTLTVTADPNYRITESSESNNTISTIVRIY